VNSLELLVLLIILRSPRIPQAPTRIA